MRPKFWPMVFFSEAPAGAARPKFGDLFFPGGADMSTAPKSLAPTVAKPRLDCAQLLTLLRFNGFDPSDPHHLADLLREFDSPAADRAQRAVWNSGCGRKPAEDGAYVARALEIQEWSSGTSDRQAATMAVRSIWPACPRNLLSRYINRVRRKLAIQKAAMKAGMSAKK